MIKLDGMNAEPASSITINASHVSATIGGKPTDLRSPSGDFGNWYDEKHMRVVNAIRELEASLRELIYDVLPAK